MSRAAIFPVIAKTGPVKGRGTQISIGKTKSDAFIVGVSEVGGNDRVKGAL